MQIQILTGKLAGTYSPLGEGKFFFTMMAAFAERERDIPLERTMAGLAATRGQGRTGGRPTVMDADELAAAHARRTNGESPTSIAKALGVSGPAFTATSPRPTPYDELRRWATPPGHTELPVYQSGDAPVRYCRGPQRVRIDLPPRRVFTVCLGCVRCAW